MLNMDYAYSLEAAPFLLKYITALEPTFDEY